MEFWWVRSCKIPTNISSREVDHCTCEGSNFQLCRRSRGLCALAIGPELHSLNIRGSECDLVAVWSLGFCGSWATGMPAAQPCPVSRQGERLWGDRPFGRRFDGTLAEVFSEHPLHGHPWGTITLVLRRFETLRGAFISLLLASEIFGDNKPLPTDINRRLVAARISGGGAYVPSEYLTKSRPAQPEQLRIYQSCSKRPGEIRGSVLSCAEHIRQTAWVDMVWYFLAACKCHCQY